jgi:NRPS condensation-like uncharacterized protein
MSLAVLESMMRPSDRSMASALFKTHTEAAKRVQAQAALQPSLTNIGQIDSESLKLGPGLEVVDVLGFSPLADPPFLILGACSFLGRIKLCIGSLPGKGVAVAAEIINSTVSELELLSE